MPLVGITYYEEVDTVPKCTGPGQISVLIGTTDLTGAPTEYKSFIHYDEVLDPLTGFGDDGGELAEGIRDYFMEGRDCYDPTVCPIPKLYAINVGSTPTQEDWTTAFATAARIKDAEQYILVGGDESGAYDLDIWNAMADALDDLASKGFFRIGYVGRPSTLTDADDVAALTDPAQTDYIRSSRICVVDDPNLHVKVAAKEAKHYEWENPGMDPFKTVDPTEITERDDSELLTLKNAGITTFWMFPYQQENGPRIYWPVMSSYRLYQGSRPVDAELHLRRNCDARAGEAVRIAVGQLYKLSTAEAMQALEIQISSIFSEYKKKGVIRDYEVTVTENIGDPNIVDITMAIKPAPSTEYIRVKSRIIAPVINP